MTKTQFIHILTVALAVLSGLMAYSDKLQALGFISPQVAQYWPVVLAGASALRGVVLFFGDWLDDGKINQSFK